VAEFDKTMARARTWHLEMEDAIPLLERMMKTNNNGKKPANDKGVDVEAPPVELLDMSHSKEHVPLRMRVSSEFFNAADLRSSQQASVTDWFAAQQLQADKSQSKELKVAYDDDAIDDLMLTLRETRTEKSTMQLFQQAEEAYSQIAAQLKNQADQLEKQNTEITELRAQLNTLEARTDNDSQSVSTDLKELKEEGQIQLSLLTKLCQKTGILA